MADHTQVCQGIKRESGTSYPVLVPNTKGLNAAVSITYSFFRNLDFSVLKRMGCKKK